MTPLAANRRRFAAALAGAALWPAGLASAAIVGFSEASRLPSATPYRPPTSLALIADLYSRMTIPVRINGLGPYRFVIDTGANQSVMALELADQLGLARGPLEPLHGVAGVQMTPTAIVSLTVGDRAETGAVVSLLPASAIGGNGLLGLDRIADQCVTLDFQGQRMTIGDARGDRHAADIAMRAHRRDGQLTLIDAEVADVPVTAFLDSGAQNTIGNLALMRLAALRNPNARWTRSPVLSATGQTIDAEIANLPRLRIGGLSLPDWTVAFVDLHTFRIWNLIDRPAILLGVDVLSRFEQVSLDFARGEVRFRLPRSV